MVDFNTKKNILQKLRRKRSENKLLWLPCVIAAAFVKLWYGTVCRIGMALSDKNGNFLGIKMSERKSDSRNTRKQARRQDDIVYVKKPFIGRLVSAVLAASFVLMVAPELNIDLGVRASAADSSVSITVESVDGRTYHLVPKVDDSGDEGDAYLYDECYHAEHCVTVKNIQYVTANGTLKLNWEYDILATCNCKDLSGMPFNSYSTDVILDHYQVIIKKASGAEVVNKNNGRDTEFVVENLPNDDNEYKVEIIPVSTMEVWHFQKDPTSTTDPPKFNVADTRKREAIPLGQIKASPATVTGLKFNAALTAPVFNVMYMDESNNLTSFDSSAPYYYGGTTGGKVYLQWETVKQTGGNAPDTGKDATGYRIHIKEGDGSSWKSTAYPVGGNSPISVDGNVCTFVVDNLKKGLHYQFYVEAYKVNWNDKGGISDYNDKNPGMISSGTDPAAGVSKDLYTSPNTPQITKVEQNISASGKPFYEITVSHNGGDKNYDGIYLFRTQNKVLTNTQNTDYRTFGEWLKENSSELEDGNPDYYNLKYIPSAFNSSNTYQDKDIVEGVTYYYYVVAYKSIPKGQNADDILYSDRYSTGSTTFRLNDFKAITPSIPRLTITDDQITVDWDAIPGAEKYYIEIVQTGKYNDKNETETIDDKNLGTKPVDTNTYPHVDLNYSDRYKYRICGFVNMETMSPVPARDEKGEIVKDRDGNIVYEKDENGNTVYEKVTGIYTQWSDWAEGTVGTRIGTPTITDVVSADGQLTVKWTAVPGAAGYYLEYRNINTPSDNGIITCNTTSHVHRNLKNGNVYSYRVCAYKEIKIKGTPQKSQLVSGNYSDWYTPVRVGDELLIPQNLRLTTKDGEITATWDPVKGATGYILYSQKDGTYGDPDEFRVSGTTFTQTGLSNGDVYTYQVRAIKRVNGEDDPSELSTPASIKVGEELNTPQDLKATTKDGEITISWTAVSGAKGYKLWYRKVGSGTFTSIDVTKPPFTHTGLNNGDVYEYYVTAYKEVNGKMVTGPDSVTIKQMVGTVLDAPKDFTVTVNDGKADMKWTAVKGAEGYIIHASSGGRYYQFDVSKVTYTHSDLSNGDIWTYYVTAYKTVNGERTYSTPSESKTVTIGITLNSAVDLTATAGNRQIDLKWTAVKGAEGYVVYLYNSKTMEFEPITVTSKTSYSHVGLKNGKQYTYMVAPYKTINGKRYYGDYSLSVTAIPTTGSITDMDHELIVKGTAPYGISHGEYISAVSNHGAFDESVDVYFTTNRESTQAVRDVLKNYADGLSSFIIYPFDISIYRENTHIEVDPADGYTVTVTIPVPDRLIAYRDYITVVHIGDEVEESERISLAEDWYNNYDRRLEVLPCAIVDIDNVWCVQFKCSSFSPYAFVIYKEHIQDVASGGGLMDTGFSDTFNSGVLLFTALPDIMPHNRKLKIVQSGSKRYHIKSVTKK